jgi:hypothetical protein
MIQALETDHTIRHHDEYGGFTQTTTDIEWITKLAAGDPEWVVISGDGRILKKKMEAAALAKSKLRFFCLAGPWLQMDIYEHAWKFVKAWPQIVEHAKHSNRLIFKIAAGGALKVEPVD